MLKKILGFAPKLESDGSCKSIQNGFKRWEYLTSTDFENISLSKIQCGKIKKVLVIFTEEKNLKMKNGKFFSTKGNHSEALLTLCFI